MNGSMLAHLHVSFRHAIVCAAALALVTALGGCDKKDGAGAAGSASASTTTAAAPAAAAAAKKPKTTLKAADIRATYKSEMESTAHMKDPMDKRVEAFVAKVGTKPEADSGRKKTWYALDGDKCVKLEIDTKDGSLTDASTDKADCGL